MAWTDLTTRSTGYKVTAANWNEIVNNINQMDTWTAFTPALEASTTNPTLGSGSSAVGRYWVVGSATAGGLCVAQVKITFGSSGVNEGSGNYRIADLPFDIVVGSYTGVPVGTGYVEDSGASARWLASPVIGAAGYVELALNNEAARSVRHNVPFTFAASDFIAAQFTFPIA